MTLEEFHLYVFRNLSFLFDDFKFDNDKQAAIYYQEKVLDKVFY